jgi:ribokinase
MSQHVTILSLGKAVQDVFLKDNEFDPHIEGKIAYTHLPLGAKLDISEAYFTTGGNATNVATTFARQGLESVYAWVLGNDPASQASIAALDAESVDTKHVIQQEGISSSYSTVLLAPSGERTILNYKGTLPGVKQVEKVLDDLDGVEVNWVYPTALGSVNVLASIIAWSKERLAHVMLNPAGSELDEPDKLKALLHDVDVLCLNKEEMQLLVEGETIEELVLHGLSLCSVVIVSDGPNGVCASDGKTILTAGMYEDVPVVDRTGAGDAFASGFLSQWVKGKSLRESIVFASANSTSVVGVIGAKPGILHVDAELHDMEITEKKIGE